MAELILERFCTGSGRNKTPQCGIIYCTTTYTCEEVATSLNDMLEGRMGSLRDGARRVTAFHAKLDPADKERIQQDWSTGVLPIVVATIAFGMGINKPDVRFVFHFSLAKSLEGYLQESGRAGRDGKKAQCILFFSWPDFIKIKHMMTKSVEENAGRGGSKAQREMQLGVHIQSLNEMAAFCTEECRCRREMLLEHFGERFDSQQCRGTCDNCARMGGRPVVLRDVTEAAQISKSLFTFVLIAYILCVYINVLFCLLLLLLLLLLLCSIGYSEECSWIDVE